MARPTLLPDKLFFRIGEVSELVGVRPHVLRYWEEEFGILKPMKTRGAHRQYRRRDVELALVIKKLLHEDGFTVAGARKKLRELGHLEAVAIGRQAAEASTRALELRAELLAVRAELASLLARIDVASRDERERAKTSTTDAHPSEVVVRIETSARSER
ncbi:MerR family transcriptional regulator [Sandaracinus amylolyticus]|uniref:Transcriptional regulator, MerR family protein n=1 Tax=Sandaracinus amylolyticus TaxID=927083 RepID=A0A0F6W4R7_9BACT|nr:MerR family transcriptional regulator [Sandaracinus amylolyticus]AKF07450.1 Transcriptional regulator, MerR family protein [Sandaracinus amylolyticus]